MSLAIPSPLNCSSPSVPTFFDPNSGKKLYPDHDSHSISLRIQQAVEQSLSFHTPLDARLTVHLTGNGVLEARSFDGHIVEVMLNYAAADLRSFHQSDCVQGFSQRDLLSFWELTEELEHAAKICGTFEGDLDKSAAQEKSLQLSTLLIESLKKARVGKKILLPGGYRGTSITPGHAMLYEFEKMEDNHIHLHVFNTGEGIWHHSQTVIGDTRKVFTQISFDLGPCSNLFSMSETFTKIFLLQNLIPDQKDPIDYLYSTILFKELSKQGASLIQERNLLSLMSEQKSGLCAYHSILALLKSRLSKTAYKTFRFYAKTKALHQLAINQPAYFHPSHPHGLAIAAICEKTKRQIESAGLDSGSLLPSFPTKSVPFTPGNIAPKPFFNYRRPAQTKYLFKIKTHILIFLYWIQCLGEQFVQKITDLILRAQNALLFHSKKAQLRSEN